MRQRGHRRPHREELGLVDLVCVAVVLIAVALLVAWIVTHAGGGVLNLG